MNEFLAPLKFLAWAATVVLVLGLAGGSLRKLTYKVAEAAVEAHKHDQISYGNFSRQLWSKKR